MAVVIRKPARAKTRTKAKASKPRASSLAQDAAERKKIGKSLDVAAFMSRHKTNGKSKQYWQQREPTAER